MATSKIPFPYSSNSFKNYAPTKNSNLVGAASVTCNRVGSFVMIGGVFLTTAQIVAGDAIFTDAPSGGANANHLLMSSSGKVYVDPNGNIKTWETIPANTWVTIDGVYIGTHFG